MKVPVNTIFPCYSTSLAEDRELPYSAMYSESNYTVINNTVLLNSFTKRGIPRREMLNLCANLEAVQVIPRAQG